MILSNPSQRPPPPADWERICVFHREFFRLTKFISNNSDALSSVDALSSIPAEDHVISTPETKVLGQTWCLRADSYTAPPLKSVDIATTRTHFFSLVSFYIRPHRLAITVSTPFQDILLISVQLCSKWDQAIPDQIQSSVDKLIECYRATPNVSVPRPSFRSATTVELHVFTDESITAFVAVIYAHQPASSQSSVQQNSALGKSRVSATKRKCILKLELEAAVLGVRLLQTVREAFSCTFSVLDRQLCRFGLDTASDRTISEFCRPQSKWSYSAIWPARLELSTKQTPTDHGTHP